MDVDQHDTSPHCEIFRQPYPFCDIGIRKRTVVPCPTVLSISSLLPMTAARSRMLLPTLFKRAPLFNTRLRFGAALPVRFANHRPENCHPRLLRRGPYVHSSRRIP